MFLLILENKNVYGKVLGITYIGISQSDRNQFRSLYETLVVSFGWKKLDFSETTLQMEFESSGKAEVCIKVNEDLCQAKEMSGIETDIKFAFQITRNRPYIVTLS